MNNKDTNKDETTNKWLCAFTADKAGMEGWDKEKIAKIIKEATKNSRISMKNENEEKKFIEEAEETKQNLIKFHKNVILYNQTKQAADICINKWKLERRYDKIWMHLDMDMFFAAVEIRDDPSLATIPMAVGTTAMLSTSNYLARKYGVRSAMPGFVALKLCPQLKIIPGNYKKYIAVSNVFMNILKEYDENIERMGIDEAYVDLTKCCEKGNWVTEEQIKSLVMEIKAKIFNATQLTCSCGISPNKTLAKICSDYNKPDGIYYWQFDNDYIENFMKDLSIRKLPFLGSKMEKRLNWIGISKIRDLKERYVDLCFLFNERIFDFFMRGWWGWGKYEHDEIKEGKSISRSDSFHWSNDIIFIKSILLSLTSKVWEDMEKEKVFCKTITVELTNKEEKKVSRCSTNCNWYNHKEGVLKISFNLLDELLERNKWVRMVRVRASGLIKQEIREEKKNEIMNLFKWMNEEIEMKKKEMEGDETSEKICDEESVNSDWSLKRVTWDNESKIDNGNNNNNHHHQEIRKDVQVISDKHESLNNKTGRGKRKTMSPIKTANIWSWFSNMINNNNNNNTKPYSPPVKNPTGKQNEDNQPKCESNNTKQDKPRQGQSRTHQTKKPKQRVKSANGTKNVKEVNKELKTLDRFFIIKK